MRKLPRTIPSMRAALRNYPVCIRFRVGIVDENEREQDDDAKLNELTPAAKALFEQAIRKRFVSQLDESSGIVIRPTAVQFGEDEYIVLRAVMDRNPLTYKSSGFTLAEWVEVINEKSIWQYSFGGDGERYVSSDGTLYKFTGVAVCE